MDSTDEAGGIERPDSGSTEGQISPFPAPFPPPPRQPLSAIFWKNPHWLPEAFGNSNFAEVNHRFTTVIAREKNNCLAFAVWQVAT